MSYRCTCGAVYCKVWVSRSCKYRHELAKLLEADAAAAPENPPELPNEDLASAPRGERASEVTPPRDGNTYNNC